MKLQNKIAFITGATGVIGATITRYFADEGCSLMLSGRSEEKLQTLKQEFDQKVPVSIYPADVGNLQEMQRMFGQIEKETTHLDILVTAAGIYGEIGTIEQCDGERWMDAIRINLFGTFLAVKYALPFLKKSEHGKIILFAGGGEGSLPHFTSYASSKGAILRFTESAAEECKLYGIAVNAMYPGLVNSGLTEEIIRVGPERVGRENYQKTQDEISGKEKTVPPDMAAQLAVFLGSDESNGLTGKILSARWDPWQKFSDRIDELMKSNVYTMRRVKST